MSDLVLPNLSQSVVSVERSASRDQSTPAMPCSRILAHTKLWVPLVSPGTLWPLDVGCLIGPASPDFFLVCSILVIAFQGPWRILWWLQVQN